MTEVLGLVALVSLATATSAVARRSGLLAPIVLVLVGIGVSLLPDGPSVELDPELVLYGFLPPLIYVAANEASVPDFRANLRPILLLAVGLVLVTAGAVALVVHLVLPDVPVAAAVAIGAVVAPPDAVSAIAIAKRVGLPRRMVTILEGEGMLNDATALVTLKVAVAALAGSAVTAWDVTADAVTAVGGGIAVGAAVALGSAALHRRLDDPLLRNTLSLLAPFVAYAAAERIHGSGVVAVVIVGLYLGHRWTVLVSAASRLQMQAFWWMVNFVLESTVFLLVGLQVRDIWSELDQPTSEIVGATIAVVATVIVVRFAWIFPATYLGRLVPRDQPRDPAIHPRVPALLSWAGMRGIITLAAALTLPFEDGDGAPLTDRALLVWLAVAVILATLLIQGTTLAPLVRRLGVKGTDPADDARAFAAVQQAASRAGLARLDEVAGDAPPEVVELLRAQSRQRARAASEGSRAGDAETPAATYRRLRIAMVEAERAAFRQARDEGRLPEELMQRAERHLDLEEALLSRPARPSLGTVVEGDDAVDLHGDPGLGVDLDVGLEVGERDAGAPNGLVTRATRPGPPGPGGT